jgi:hypothetical protein
MKKNLIEFNQLSKDFEKEHISKATDKVWKVFNKSFESIEPSLKKMFSEYLEGSSVKLLSQKYKFSESEITDLINQIKRKMIENLKGSYSVRQ